MRKDNDSPCHQVAVRAGIPEHADLLEEEDAEFTPRNGGPSKAPTIECCISPVYMINNLTLLNFILM